MKTVAIISQKGGSGKTTLAVHLAVCAERARRRVAIIDLDPQASALEWGVSHLLHMTSLARDPGS